MEGVIEVYESKKNALSKMMKRFDYLERNKHRVKLRKRDKKEEWINVTSTPSCAAPYRRHVNSVSGDRVAH